jgi:hypothetical protein
LRGVLTPLWFSLVPVTIVGLIVGWQCRPISQRHTLVFAWCYEVAMTPVNLRLIKEYLGYQRRLRALLVGGAVVLPGLVAWAIAGSSAGSGLDVGTWWPLWMVIVATVWGEVAFARPVPGPGAARVAQLEPRRLADYLARRWQWVPVAASAVAVAAWVAVLFIPLVDRDADTPSAFDVATGVALAVAVPLIVFCVGTWVVRRPQPVVSADVLTADDAVRAASVRTLATVGTTIVLIDVAGGLIPWSVFHGAVDALVAVGVTVALLLAWLSWSAHDVWARPRHRPARPRPSTRTGAAS